MYIKKIFGVEILFYLWISQEYNCAGFVVVLILRIYFVLDQITKQSHVLASIKLPITLLTNPRHLQFSILTRTEWFVAKHVHFLLFNVKVYKVLANIINTLISKTDFINQYHCQNTIIDFDIYNTWKVEHRMENSL